MVEKINNHEVKRHKPGDIDSYKYKCIKCHGFSDNKEDFEKEECTK